MKPATALLAFILLSTGALAHAEILTLVSDKGIYGIPPGTVPVYGSCNGGQGNALVDGNSSDGNPPEGRASFKLADTVTSPCRDTYVGWGIALIGSQNLSRFSPGELRFWANASSGDIKIEIKDAAGATVFSKVLSEAGWSPALAGQWRQYRIPFTGNLSGSALNAVVNPILFTALSVPTQFYIDNVRYVDSTELPIFDVTVRNISDDAEVGALDWKGVTLPTSWQRANQYLDIEVDSAQPSWGVQIYTDNTSAAADPVFRSPTASGQPGSNPAGLVDVDSTTLPVPLAWSIKAEPDAPQAADPTNNSDLNASQWLFMKDKATPDIPLENTTAFSNNDPFVVLKNNTGIHFGQRATDFGAEDSPNAVYLEADFSHAVTPRTYRTRALFIEYFTL